MKIAKILQKCISCQEYSLGSESRACPFCGNQTKSAHPPRFSPQDKYGRFRRAWKKIIDEQR